MIDAASIRTSAPLMTICDRLGIELKRSGQNQWKGLCPFHQEKSASFTVRQAKDGWCYHCFGCGAGGDAIAFWMQYHGKDFQTALTELAPICGVSPGAEWKPERRAPRREDPPQERDARREDLPVLRPFSDDSCEELGRLRGVSPEAVRLVCDLGMLGGTLMGISTNPAIKLCWGETMRQEARKAQLRTGAMRAWVVTDCHRRNAQARRMDGRPWGRDGAIKAWTIGSASWPLMSNNIAKCTTALLVEGGPDILAAAHLMLAAGLKLGIVAVLGASVRLRPDALNLLMGKRVIIIPHCDKVDPKNGRQAGYEAARRWHEQMRTAGIGIKSAEIRLPYVPPDTGDLNDAVRQPYVRAGLVSVLRALYESSLWPADGWYDSAGVFTKSEVMTS